jgi:hypothetical protein
MNANEPVAWIDPKELDMDVSTSVTKHKQFDTDIPLYTYEQITPSGFLNASEPIYPAKTLTDEEIMEIMSEFYSYNPRLLEFARAILRKAQEK